jgi:hypothetical protein
MQDTVSCTHVCERRSILSSHLVKLVGLLPSALALAADGAVWSCVLAAAASDVAADFGIAACIGHIETTEG